MTRKTEIDIGTLPTSEAYKLLTAVVIPRPIAWITSLDSGGKVNAAPFSFFTCLATQPPMVGTTVMRRNGEEKDTARNVRETGEYVINIVTKANAQAMNRTSIDAPPEFDEVAFAGLHLEPSRKVRTPSIAEAPVHLECRLKEVLSFGEVDGGTNPTSFLVGEVVYVRMTENLYQDGRVDMESLQAIGRLGGFWYTDAQPTLEMPRPQWAEFMHKGGP